jgi:hypothetical protein
LIGNTLRTDEVAVFPETRLGRPTVYKGNDTLVVASTLSVLTDIPFTICMSKAAVAMELAVSPLPDISITPKGEVVSAETIRPS